MSIYEVEYFRKRYAHFLKWLSYMAKRRLKMDPKSELWKKILKDFDEKVVAPMDEAWSKLTDKEKRLFGPGDGRKKQVLENCPF